jgi:predicted dehydrogenase
MRVGLVGCGVAIHHHIPAILDIPGTEIVGLCDIDKTKSQSIANRFGIGNTYTQLEELLASARPEVAHIMTPPKTHLSLTLDAINEGCHVLVEKPMTITTVEADRMIEAAASNEVKLCVMHNHLFDPHIIKAKEMLTRGVLGDLLHVEVKYCLDKKKMDEEGLSRSDHWAHNLPLGIFGEYIPHLVYLALLFLGFAQSVQVSRKNIAKSSSELINAISVQIDGEKAMGQILMLDNMDYGHFGVKIYGTKQALHINMLDLTMNVERERNLPTTIARMLSTVDQSIQSLACTTSNIAKIVTGRLKRRPGHRMLIKKFYETIQNNGKSPVNGEDGKEVVRVLELIQQKLNMG